MRYHILATDYDGTLASHGRVAEETIVKLKQLKATGCKLVLVTGREMKDLVIVFPAYGVFDHIVAENGALIHEVSTGEEKLLGQPPDASFIKALQDKGVPFSIGKVIVATYEPHEQAVLEVIKSSGSERQLIFNKGSVMILPPGINKAIGLQTLLRSQYLSAHNTVAVGDAENDHALLQAAECAVAVGNAIPALKSAADWVTDAEEGKGVEELIDQLVGTDLAGLDERLVRHYLELGTSNDNHPFLISSYRSGILLSGASGSGKTTFTLSLVEELIRQDYQFCLVDPEGDYLDLPGAVVMGNELSLPSIEEIRDLLKDPSQRLVVCTLSVPLADRPAFFAQLLSILVELRRTYGHPHWIILDEAHHLIPAASVGNMDTLPAGFNNFVLISTSPHALSALALSKIGMVITIGNDSAYALEQFCKILELPVPGGIPSLNEGEICVWNREVRAPLYKVNYRLPHQLLQRHKKKYAQGDMGSNAFVFTGPEKKLQLVANNLLLFMHIAEGIDEETWLFHLRRKDFTRWFREAVHDEELVCIGEEAEKTEDPAASRKHIVEFISRKYTA
jgi:hydroxymethylpyrimidine pyrophosphatase-like HAD family hydrolase/GTPase SAR1 family protein